MTASAQRVLGRYLLSRTAADYKEYLKRKKREGEKPLSRDEWSARIEGGPKEAPEKAKGGLLGKLKGKLSQMSQKAKATLTKAPEAVQRFFTDSKHRKEALGKARKAIQTAPHKYAQSLVKTAKHEVHEFKEAGHGIAAIMSGKKATPQQKKAIKTVATHLAITAAAAVVSTTGFGAGAAFMGKAIGKHIALKAAAESLGSLHTLGEAGHVVEQITHSVLAAESEKADPDEALALLVMGKTLDQLDKLSDDDMADILEAATKDEDEDEDEEKDEED